jgi:putative ABC transport system permease protein
MSFFKRGLLSITRRPGKSIILLAVLFILGNVIAGAISITQATSNVESTIKDRLGSAATIELDYEQLDKMEESELMNFEMQPLKLDLIEEIGQLSYVKYYDFNTMLYLGSKEVNAYYGEDTEVDFAVEENEEYISTDFQFKGINYAPVVDFEEGKGKLVDGRVFTEDEIKNGTPVAIISSKIAELNSVHVGDTISFINSVYSFNEETGEESVDNSREVPIEIIGIFEPQKVNTDTENNEEFNWMDIDYQNTVYVSNELVAAETKHSMGEMAGEYEEYYVPIFVLKQPEDAQAFEEEVNPLLPELYVVRHASDAYDSIAKPIESMSTLSKYVLIVSIATTILIIGLVVLLFLRDRKHELGIYLSLGESRGKVIGQIMTEVLIVSIIGMTLSLFTGNLLAQSVSDKMIESNNEQTTDEMFYYSELQTDLTTDDVLAAYEVNLSTEFILLFYGVGIATILLSTLIPLIYIMRLNPKKIMM